MSVDAYESMQHLTRKRAKLLESLAAQKDWLATEELRLQLEMRNSLKSNRTAIAKLERDLAILNGELREATMRANEQVRSSE